MKPAELKGLMYLNVNGLGVWIKETDFYARMGNNDLQVTYTHANTYQPHANGDRIRFSFKGFQPYFKGRFEKIDNQNEITFWLTLPMAKKLQQFLNKILDDKP